MAAPAPDHRQDGVSYIQPSQGLLAPNSYYGAAPHQMPAQTTWNYCSDPNCMSCQQPVGNAGMSQAHGLSGTQGTSQSAIPTNAMTRRPRKPNTNEVVSQMQPRQAAEPVQPYLEAPVSMPYNGQQFEQAGQHYSQSANFHWTQAVPLPQGMPGPQTYKSAGHTRGYRNVTAGMAYAEASASSSGSESSGEEESGSLKISWKARRIAKGTRYYIRFCKRKLRSLTETSLERECLCAARLNHRLQLGDDALSRIDTIRLALHPLQRRWKKLTKRSKELQQKWRKHIYVFRTVLEMARSLSRDAKKQHHHNIKHFDSRREALDDHEVRPIFTSATLTLDLSCSMDGTDPA